jgi:multiple sugar transport system substrate-binding protein
MRRLKTILLATAVALGAATAHAEDVTFMNWTYTEETGKAAIQEMIDGFAAASGNTVVPEGYAWGEMTKNYLLRARSNNLPDVGQSQERLLPMLKGIDVVDFNEVYGREALEEMFAPAQLAMGEVDGKQIGLPWIGGTVGWVANADVLEKAGVAEMPATMDEFRAALEKVRDAVPGAVPFGLATKNPNSIVLDYLIMVKSFGGDLIGEDGSVNANSPEAVEALTFLAGLVRDRLAAPEIDRPDARRLFGQGATAFYIDAPQARTFARQFSGRGEEIDAAVKPIKGPVAEAGSTPVSIQWGHTLSLFKDENAKADGAAADFVEYLLSDAVLVPYATGQSTLPMTKTGLASEAVTSDPFLADWAAATVDPIRHVIASLDNGAEVSTIIGEEYQAALLGQKSPQEAADAMQSRLEAAMGR